MSPRVGAYLQAMHSSVDYDRKINCAQMWSRVYIQQPRVLCIETYIVLNIMRCMYIEIDYIMCCRTLRDCRLPAALWTTSRRRYYGSITLSKLCFVHSKTNILAKMSGLDKRDHPLLQCKHTVSGRVLNPLTLCAAEHYAIAGYLQLCGL
jgi:hypothetical protein